MRLNSVSSSGPALHPHQIAGGVSSGSWFERLFSSTSFFANLSKWEANKATREINRIERKLDAKGEPRVQPPKSCTSNGEEAGERPRTITISMQSLWALSCQRILGWPFGLEKNYQLGRRHNSAQGRSEGLLVFWLVMESVESSIKRLICYPYSVRKKKQLWPLNS